MTGRRLLRLWSAGLKDEGAIAAVEFALIVPVLLVVYLVGFEALEAIAAYRKVSDTTIELANVAAQYTTMSSTDVSNVMSASAQIMAPYSTSNLSIVLSEITTNASKTATVTWSQAYNGGTALATGSAVTLPAGMASASTSYLYVQTSYAWSPVVNFESLAKSITMSDQLYMLPRQSSSIPYTG